MERTQNLNDYQSAFCYFLSQTEHRNKLASPGPETLVRPEESINLNESSSSLPVEPEEELEEDIFSEDDETTDEVQTQSRCPDPEEQVVPSSQSSYLSHSSQLSDNSYKYNEEDATTDIEEDEGIFEDELASEGWTLAEKNRRSDSQPP